MTCKKCQQRDDVITLYRKAINGQHTTEAYLKSIENRLRKSEKDIEELQESIRGVNLPGEGSLKRHFITSDGEGGYIDPNIWL